jgi:hypothetical protein
LHAPLSDGRTQRPLELLVQGTMAVAPELHQQVNWPFDRAHNWNCTRGQRGRTVFTMIEAHETVGGRARSTDGAYKANLGPHAIYVGGVLSDWLEARGLMPPLARPLLTGVRFHYGGAVHRTPPLSLIPPGLRLRGRMAPVDQTFRAWVNDHSDPRTADYLSSSGSARNDCC